MKIWQKESVTGATSLAAKVEAFTVGNDKTWDTRLARYDVTGSLAHAAMLHSIDLLTSAEHAALTGALEEILQDIDKGAFVIEEGVEDVHSQVELLLIRRLGDTGKKIHSGRSRNDQSLLDIKLFIRHELQETADGVKKVFEQLLALSEQHKEVLLPGYTHLQVAMPSSFGLWFGAYAESLADDMEMLLAAYRIADRNPLGSAAGYGTSFPLDREMTTGLLGFSGMNVNSVYAQMTRGKTEKVTSMALAVIAATLGRFAADVCLYLSQNFSFLEFPDELTTGSSIMPHKKNPDVFELLRAKCNRIQAVPNELSLLCANLPSGYHRDMQLTKECLFPALEEMKDCLEMMREALDHIRVKENLCDDEKYQYLFSVEAVNALVMEGLSFRDAYRQVGKDIAAGMADFTRQPLHTHIGSIGNLRNDLIAGRFQQLYAELGLADQARG